MKIAYVQNSRPIGEQENLIGLDVLTLDFLPKFQNCSVQKFRIPLWMGVFKLPTR